MIPRVSDQLSVLPPIVGLPMTKTFSPTFRSANERMPRTGWTNARSLSRTPLARQINQRLGRNADRPSKFRQYLQIACEWARRSIGYMLRQQYVSETVPC